MLAIKIKKLLGLITSGRLPPTRPISERQIANELGIGRTPVREAMRALAHDGLLEIIPARGTFVAGISEDQLRELVFGINKLHTGPGLELIISH